MSWQLLLVVNLFAATVREALNKRIADTISPFVSLFYITLFSLTWFFVAFVSHEGRLPTLNLAVAAPGVLFVAAFVAYFKALKISLSQSILFQSYSILVTIVLSAMFLGEIQRVDPTTIQGARVLTGATLAVIALWLLLHPAKKREERVEKRWFVYIGISVITLGVGAFFSVFSLERATPVEVLINQSSMMVPLYLLLNIAGKTNLRITKKQSVLTFASSLVSAVAVLAYLHILTNIPVAQIMPLQQVLLVLVTMIVGIVVYKEQRVFTGKRLVGMIVGLGGIILLLTT